MAGLRPWEPATEARAHVSCFYIISEIRASNYAAIYTFVGIWPALLASVAALVLQNALRRCAFRNARSGTGFHRCPIRRVRSAECVPSAFLERAFRECVPVPRLDQGPPVFSPIRFGSIRDHIRVTVDLPGGAAAPRTSPHHPRGATAPLEPPFKGLRPESIFSPIRFYSMFEFRVDPTRF